MRCLECGAESAETAEVCVRCGAPISLQQPVAAAAAGAASSGDAGQAASTATAGATGQTSPEPYVPGRPGAKVPAQLRLVPEGYVWMGGGAVFGVMSLAGVGAFFQVQGSPADRWYYLAGIAMGVLAVVLFTRGIRWSSFFRQPGQASSATVTACRRGGRVLMLDAPGDAYPSGLQVRFAWWAEPAMLRPGENVTCYGRRGGAGRLLVSSSEPGKVFAGTGRRRPAPLAGGEAPQDAWYQPGGQQAGRRYLRWGPLVIFNLGAASTLVATLIVTVPGLTPGLSVGQLQTGDCLAGSNMGLGNDSPWPSKVTQVACTQWHEAEVFFVGNIWPQSLAYPGDSAVDSQSNAQCNAAFDAYDGVDDSANTGSSLSPSEFSYTEIVPDSYSWSEGDRSLVCVAYEWSSSGPSGGTPVNYSIKGRHK